MWTAILLTALAANVLIFVHELGHLLAAKWAGMPVASFSVGLGPKLFGIQYGETRYQLALIPLGGFVSIRGMKGTAEERLNWPTGFAFQPLYKRMIVIGAGVAMNAVLAGLLYAGLALTGGAAAPIPSSIAAVFEESLPPGAAGWGTVPRNRIIDRLGSAEVSEWSDLALAILGADAGPAMMRFADGSSAEVVLPAEKSDRIELLGAILPALPPVLGRVELGSPARAAGLATGDRIRALNDEPIETFADWLAVGGPTPSEPVRLQIESAGTIRELTVAPSETGFIGQGSFGWLGAHLGNERSGAGIRDAFLYGANQVEKNARLIATSGKLLASGAISIRELSGPVEIARMSEEAFLMNWHQFFSFVAFLSLNLAVLNFLPIPVLDGGHFFMLVAEGVRGRRLPPAVSHYANLAGASVIGFFMVFAVMNDVLKLFGW
ncbi:MAG: RIP metalloprotease RseP [Gemmatimonadota bacterium]